MRFPIGAGSSLKDFRPGSPDPEHRDSHLPNRYNFYDSHQCRQYLQRDEAEEWREFDGADVKGSMSAMSDLFEKCLFSPCFAVV